MADDIFEYVSGKELMDKHGFNEIGMHLLPLQRYKESYRYGLTEPFEIPNEETPGLLTSNVGPRKIWGKIGIQIHPTNALPCEDDDFCKIIYKRSEIETLKKERPEIFNKNLPINDSFNVHIPGKTSASINVKGNETPIDLDDNTLSDHLKIAIEAWAALYRSGEHNQWKTGHKRKIKEWIERKYPELSGTAIDRIVRVVNLNPNGGALRSTSD